MRDLIEEELARSRAIIADGSELVPRFRLVAEDGETLIFVQLPDDLAERNKRMDLVQSYMAVKMVRSFVMASELMEPDASMAIGVSHNFCEAAMQVIKRKPLSFDAPAWLDRSSVGDEIPAMLPPRVANVSDEQIAMVEHLVKYNEGLRLQSL